MDSSTLEFFIKLKDLASSGLVQFAQNAKTHLGKVQNLIENVGSSMKGMVSGLFLGAGVGLVGILTSVGVMAHEGVEKVHELHMAEAALANTMKNMGTYSEESFEKAVKGADDLHKKILFSKSGIIDLQSQLGLVGNIGEEEMQRMVKDSADMATKFHQGLNEAGNALAKAVNNPEMMKRLAMQLKIDPAMVEHLQNLAKHGKEAQARLELLAVVEQKVGGAAEAAFNADPMAKYNVAAEDLELALGDIVTKLKVQLLPYAIKFLEWLKTAVEWIEKNSAQILIWIKGIGGAALAFKTATVFIIPFVEGLTAIGPAGAAAAVGLEEAGAAATVALGPIGILVLAIAGITAAWISAAQAQENYARINNENLNKVYNDEKKGIAADIKALLDKQKGKHKLSDAEATKIIVDSESNLLQTAMHENAFKLMAAQREFDKLGDLKNAGLSGYGENLGKAKDKIDKLQRMQDDYMAQKSALNSFSASDIPEKKTDDLLKTTTDKNIAAGITGGGPRVINISIGKMVEKLEIHANGIAAGLDDMEHRVEEHFLRILNSGASVQAN